MTRTDYSSIPPEELDSFKLMERVSFRIMDYFDYDTSFLTSDDWDELMSAIFYRMYNCGEPEHIATKHGFVDYVNDNGGPEMFGLELP